ncbi:ribonuclease HI [Caminibacter mediatlanticus TB-2]|uniref:Ribonuclease H n=1 Tax=Caminibacter mediatlanticus TB-2 TaxID=391592 RepID=A0ABX5V619_9BACT|nr:ribonuclease HI [Caminibacter mediatlanticus]QCT93722.1 ribonuclease HI [Caminibacter mediatlanticus TB-2]
MKRIEIYTDGSSLGNPGPGGWCAILRYKGKEKIISGGEEYTTNNRMELKAVIESLKILKEPCEIDLYADSIYVLKGINEWLSNWVRKNFKNVKNEDLWKEFLQYSKYHKIKVNWIKGHSGHIENERCDKIAKDEALRRKSVSK